MFWFRRNDNNWFIGYRGVIFLKFNIYINHLGILLQYSFWICKIELEMWFCIFNEFPNDDKPGSHLEQQVPNDWNWEQFGGFYAGKHWCSNVIMSPVLQMVRNKGIKHFDLVKINLRLPLSIHVEMVNKQLNVSIATAEEWSESELTF